MTPAEFIAKWKDNRLSERAGAQSHTPEMPDEEILRRLLKLYLERAAK